MHLRMIHSPQGQPEFVLLPVQIYYELRKLIDKKMQEGESEYVPFVLENYISNPVALARIKANFTQEELAKALDVTQAYVSKIERQKKVTAKTLKKVTDMLTKMTSKKK